MPGYNGTGPTGAGPMTGRGRGMCNNDPDYGRPMPDMPYGVGRGMGYGRRAGLGCGFGLGQRNRSGLGRTSPGQRFLGRNEGRFTDFNGLSHLRAEAASNRNMLDDIGRRISELEKKNG